MRFVRRIGHQRLHHNRVFRQNENSVATEIEDGARYRVRTCDPYRVKVVLYH